jgi:hypothetical protein
VKPEEAMTTMNERSTQSRRHCAYCGHAVIDESPAIERFGERFCSESHADEFVSDVRAARIQAAATPPATGCAGAPGGRRTWKDYLRQGACWGAPVLVLLAIPLFWTGNSLAIAGGSILNVLALVACPLAMLFMMRAMGSMSRGEQPCASDGADGHDMQTRRPEERTRT